VAGAPEVLKGGTGTPDHKVGRLGPTLDRYLTTDTDADADPARTVRIHAPTLTVRYAGTDMSEGRVVLVAGSSGLVGGELVELLLRTEDAARVVSLVRRPTGKIHARLDERQVVFDRLEALDLEPPVHDVFCCRGTTMKRAGSRAAFRVVDHDYPVSLGRLALRLGVETFGVVSSLGADVRSRSFYLRTKGEMERALADLGLPVVNIFRPSLLVGDRQEPRPGELVASLGLRIASPLLSGPFRRYRRVAAREVAAAMVLASRERGDGVRIVESDAIIELAAAARG
jgi:uncharacterized protein YbjT (DUF2867 family)